MTGQSFGRRAGGIAVLVAGLALATGCAGPSARTSWKTGDGLKGPAFDARVVQVAQTSEDLDSVFGAPGTEEDYDVNDPLEIPNRFLFAINRTLDVFIIQPVAATYRFMLPELLRNSIRNFLRNLQTPVILANDIFQGEWDRAETTAARFMINTTVGLGFFDVAAGGGKVYHNEDFGQTLGSYGMGEGVYLVLPLFGPSSARDAVGMVVDTFLDPLTYVARAKDIQTEMLARPAVNGIDTRSRNIEELEDLRRDSIDFYARIRSLWRQNRRNEILNGADNGTAAQPDLYDFDFSTEQANDQVTNERPL